MVRERSPDFTAWDKKTNHFDAKASEANPIWQMVDIKRDETFSDLVTIGALGSVPALKNRELERKGSRLSVQPFTEAEYAAGLKLADKLGLRRKQV